MKVAYIIGSLNRGGTETLLLDTVKNAHTVNLDSVLIHRKGGSLLKEFQAVGIPLFLLPLRSTFGLTYLVKLRHLLLKNNITTVHAQLPLDALLAYFSTVGTNISIILSFHGYDIGYSSFLKIILKFIIKRTDLNIYVSDSLMKHYKNSFLLDQVAEKQVVVHNGIDFEKFKGNIFEPLALREDLGIHKDALLIGTIGNFVDGRDQFTLCRFLKNLQEQGVNFHMVFVGKKDENRPDLYDKCVDYCNDNGLSNSVSFIGSRGDVYAILNQLDAFVYSSDHDTFGIALIEAVYAKLPVFANDWKVITEISNNGELVFLYKTKSEDDLYTKFMFYHLNKDKYKTQLELNSMKVEKLYSINRYLTQVTKLYEKLSY